MKPSPLIKIEGSESTVTVAVHSLSQLSLEGDVITIGLTNTTEGREVSFDDEDEAEESYEQALKDWEAVLKGAE